MLKKQIGLEDREKEICIYIAKIVKSGLYFLHFVKIKLLYNKTKFQKVWYTLAVTGQLRLYA